MDGSRIDPGAVQHPEPGDVRAEIPALTFAGWNLISVWLVHIDALHTVWRASPRPVSPPVHSTGSEQSDGIDTRGARRG